MNVDEEKMRKKIYNFKNSKITTKNGNSTYITNISEDREENDDYLITVSKKESGEYKIIYKGNIKIHPPKSKVALSNILGVFILMGIAGAAAGAFYFSSLSYVDDSYTTIELFEVIAFKDRSRVVHVEIIATTTDERLFKVGGDLVPLLLMENGETDHHPDVELFKGSSAITVTYDGVMNVTNNGTVDPGDSISVTIEQGDNNSMVVPVRVRGP